MNNEQEKTLGADAAEVDTACSTEAATTASHGETWHHHFERTYAGLCQFLASLSQRQAGLAKVMPGRMIGSDLYGWDVFYPRNRHRRNPFFDAFVADGDLPAGEANPSKAEGRSS